MAAAIDSMGTDKAATAFGNFIGPKLEQAGVPGIRALVEGIFAADVRDGWGRKATMGQGKGVICFYFVCQFSFVICLFLFFLL